MCHLTPCSAAHKDVKKDHNVDANHTYIYHMCVRVISLQVLLHTNMSEKDHNIDVNYRCHTYIYYMRVCVISLPGSAAHEYVKREPYIDYIISVIHIYMYVITVCVLSYSRFCRT